MSPARRRACVDHVVAEHGVLADEADVTVYTDADGPRSAGFYRKMGFKRSTCRWHQLVYPPPIALDFLPNRDDDAAPSFGPG